MVIHYLFADRLCVLIDDEDFRTVTSQCELLQNNEAHVQCTFGVDRQVINFLIKVSKKLV